MSGRLLGAEDNAKVNKMERVSPLAVSHPGPGGGLPTQRCIVCQTVLKVIEKKMKSA